MFLCNYLLEKNKSKKQKEQKTKDYNTNLSLVNYKNKELLDNILKYIHTNYQEGNLKTMSKELCYHPTYISKLIKEHFGKNFKELINEQRMKKALILLRNKELPIYQISEEVGINNLTAFYKRFQEYTKMTPQEYRDIIK